MKRTIETNCEESHKIQKLEQYCLKCSFHIIMNENEYIEFICNPKLMYSFGNQWKSVYKCIKCLN